MDIEIVVPRGGDCPYRERSWRWLREAYAKIHPDWLVVEAPAPDGPWCKAAAVIPALEASEAEIVAVVDADVWAPGLGRAVTAVQKGASWALPHQKVHRLTEEATAAVLAGAGFEGQKLAQRPYAGFIGGGAVVAPREAIEEVPLDRRFIGWGQEDESWGCALWTLLGKPWRSKQPLWHFYHPPQEREDRRRGSREAWALRKRYFDARYKPEAVRTLIDEAKEAAWAPSA